MGDYMERLTTKVMSLILVFAVQSVSVRAADAPPPAMIAETWACAYKDGKTLDDVLKLREFMVSQADRAGLKLPPAFLWTRTTGDSRFDYVWFNVHLDSGAFDTSASAWEASGIGPVVLDQFASISDCVAFTSAAQMIFPTGNPGASAPDGPVFIAAENCSYIGAANGERLNDLISDMHDVMEDMGDNAPTFATALLPFSSPASEAPDVILYSGYEHSDGWEAYFRELPDTEAGRRLREHKAEVLDCGGLTMWSSRQL